VNNVHYLPVAVAHDHGYGYLQTKDVSGAVFEGASDGVFVRTNWCRLNAIRSNKGSRVCSLRSEQFYYLPVLVAHDHGYGYLQTKDVSGAVFEGASDGVVVRSNWLRFECDRSTNQQFFKIF
jgi:hypothetical protein